jgi:MFS family permease
LVGRFGPFRVMIAGMVTVIVGLVLLSTAGVHTGYFPTVFFAFFAIGLGIGTAFMPLLSIAMADVPAADAGLGSGITNVSQQVAGALGLAVLGTVATNHTKTLVAEHHTLAASLVSGYHFAFVIGAASVSAGILVAVGVLRNRATSAAAQPASARDVAEPDAPTDQLSAPLSARRGSFQPGRTKWHV